MDDLSGLKWTASSAGNPATKPATSNYSAFAGLRPTPPVSGRASPLNGPTSQPPSKPATPANDSFANLVAFGGTSNKNLSLQEQQKRLAEAKLEEQQRKSKSLQDQYAAGDDSFWDNLGSGRGTPAADSHRNGSTAPPQAAESDDVDDLFAAFNKPSPAVNTRASAPDQPKQKHKAVEDDDDDDLFNMSKVPPRRQDTAATATTVDDDDDVLGLLGKPASERAQYEPPSPDTGREPAEVHPQDKAVAELVDMGFPADKARRALETTQSGMDVQAAVGWLLNQAHSEARQKTQSRQGRNHDQLHDDGADDSRRSGSQTSRPRPRFDDGDGPAMYRGREHGTAQGDKDFEKMASDFGANFMKTAGSLWKQGTKQIQRAVQDFGSDSDSGGQPRWMREAERTTKQEQRPQQHRLDAEAGRAQRRRSPPPADASATDEALMLESSRPAAPSKPAPAPRPDRRFDSSADNSRDHSPAVPSRLRESAPPKQPAFLRQQNQSPAAASRSTLNRQAIEDQAAQAYVSSARRRKPQPPPTSQPVVSASEPDLLNEGAGAASPSARPRTAAAISSASRVQSPPVKRIDTPVRPPPPTRTIPPITAIALKASHSHRETGNQHFKRGDYAAAHQSYTTSISHLPATHPVILVLLTNRALTGLKVGEPKTAIADADKAIALIGISKGESETVDMGNGETPKPMREYFGKALMRKAEALEQMEKWTDAAAVWREAVEGGHGGATSIQGRMRSEKAANPAAQKPKPSAPVRKAASAPPKPRNAAPSAAAAQAVSQLRAANAAAEKADDERFRLGDAVDARIAAWKGGKEHNLRALLGSLDTVLWEGSGWKKISMADLVLPGKVKIQYMKGIAKVHPDKIPTDATTQQRMIAGAVFSALNEAWDKFKAENGL